MVSMGDNRIGMAEAIRALASTEAAREETK